MKDTYLLEQLSQGCILRKKRWSGDTFIEFPDGEIDSAATDTMIERAHEAITRLRAELAESRKQESFDGEAKNVLQAAYLLAREEEDFPSDCIADSPLFENFMKYAHKYRIAKEQA